VDGKEVQNVIFMTFAMVWLTPHIGPFAPKACGPMILDRRLAGSGERVSWQDPRTGSPRSQPDAGWSKWLA